MLPSISEAEILKACLEFLAAKGIFAWRVNNIPAFDPKIGRYRSFHGLKGVSDIIGILPSQEGVGRFFCCEVKSAHGKISASQEAYLQEVDNNGGLAMIVRSIDDLEGFLEEEGH